MTSPLPPDDWARIEELFARAADLPSTERAAFLDDHAPDPEVRREVESLLGFAGHPSLDALHAIVEGEAQRLEAGSQDVDLARDDLIGSRIGPFNVIREIGRGGMGVVYLGVREEDGFEQRVAIKLLPGTLFDRTMARRFRTERRILASLEHPGVARFVDGGTTASGIPWVAMEYVDGEPIDGFCERHSLDLDARLALFVKVCDAVRYAHGKLIVHRDLKPDNILVDGEAEPKLLDFGIARLVDPDDDAGQTATLIMTPRYASPEQIAGELVTTSADVYALGAVLYLLVSGKMPHGDATSRSELLRIVTEADPVPPSQASKRPALAGDLDTIVLTAMRRDPEERYASVDRLRQDVQSYRESKPIAARPHTLAYRASKFIHRNRPVVLAGAAAVVALILGGSAAAVGLLQARTSQAAALEEARVADEVTAFLVDLFEDPTPRVSGGEERTARQLLDMGVERIGVELAGQPYLQSRLRQTMAQSYARLGAYPTADTLFALALETVEDEDIDLRASILAAQGGARRLNGDLDAALEVLSPAIVISAARTDTTDSASMARTPVATRTLIDALREAGIVLAWHDDHEPAIDTLELAHRLALRGFGEGSDWEASTAGALAFGYFRAGRIEEAIALYERRTDIVASRGENTADHLLALDNLAAVYAQSGDLERATVIFERLLPLQEAMFGPEHPSTGRTLNNMGAMYRDLGRLDDAERYLRRGLAVNIATHGPTAMAITQGLNNLALVSQDRGDWGDAEQLFLQAAQIRREALGPRNPSYASVLLGVANTRRQQRKWAGAEEAYSEAIAILRAIGTVPAVVLTDYAQVLRALGRVVEAEAVEKEAEAGGESGSGGSGAQGSS